MIRFTVETEIARPVSEVFAYVTDPAKLPTWQTNTISLTQEGDGSLEVGTRLRELHRVGGGEVESVVEVTELEPDRVFALTMIEGPLPVDARLVFESAGRGTRMVFEGKADPGGPIKFASPLLGRQIKGQFEKHCRTLKEVLEG